MTPTALIVPASAPDTDLPLEMPGGAVSSAAPGSSLTMSGSGYAPFSEVTLAVYSTPRVLGKVTADSEGAFETSIAVPDDLTLGTHSFVAAGVDENGEFRALRLDLTVAASSDDGLLPVTGAAVLWVIVAGFASVVTGVTMRRFATDGPLGRHRGRPGRPANPGTRGSERRGSHRIRPSIPE
ncbi:hypothetical protein [Actinoplanes sp. NPDC026619]|uniref:hypothetical protein n=1 Tax=Actinoplanes sp. NPDC026619 TaxID=3155798 RepID=UPI0033E0C037